MGTSEFIKSFKVASSFDGKMYMMYRTSGQRKDKVSSIDNALLFVFFFCGLVWYLHLSYIPAGVYWEHR